MKMKCILENEHVIQIFITRVQTVNLFKLPAEYLNWDQKSILIGTKKVPQLGPKKYLDLDQKSTLIGTKKVPQLGPKKYLNWDQKK